MRAMLAVLLLLAGCSGCASAPTFDSLHATTLTLRFTHSICSGTAIGPHVLLTAQHCINGTTLKLVNGQPVTVVGIGRDKHDTLTLRIKGITFKHWARLGPAPHQGDRIRWWGNPEGAPDIYREGYVAGEVDGWMVFSAGICHGDSGAGIFNSQGEVIGVISAMTDMNGCTFMLANPLAYQSRITPTTAYG